MDVQDDGHVSTMKQPTSDDSKLRSLFENDFYVHKILSCLIEDSIPECRRVCKRWHTICSELPVNIRVRQEPYLLPLIGQSFPKITELFVCGYENTPFEIKDFMTNLQRFEMLQSFSLELLLGTIKKCVGLEKMLDSLSRFPSLKLYVTGPSQPDPICFKIWSVIGRLTNLVALEVNGFPLEEPISLDALSSIQTLILPTRSFVNKNGKPSFPSLTCLTSLTISDQRDRHFCEKNAFFKVTLFQKQSFDISRS